MKRLELNKFNRQIYALTFGPQTIQPLAQKISKNRMRLNYNQHKRSIRDNGDMLLQNMIFGEKCPTVADIMDSPFSNYIILTSNYCGYGGTAEELIVNYVHPLV